MLSLSQSPISQGRDGVVHEMDSYRINTTTSYGKYPGNERKKRIFHNRYHGRGRGRSRASVRTRLVKSWYLCTGVW
jgi:hypothetical protein